MMTRQHFQKIAETIKFLDLPDEHKRKVANDLADMCASTNGRFDRQRFLTACGF